MADAGRFFRPGLPVLFITGYAEQVIMRQGELDAHMAVLAKPFSVEALGLKIREFVS
jgi:CheY-like chemotaxis protein